VHLSGLDDDGGGQLRGRREAKSGKEATGKVGDVGDAESREGAAGDSDGDNRGEGWGTSMSSTTPVEARGGNSGAANCGGTGKQYRGRGHR
jgi:hypothetical protein